MKYDTKRGKELTKNRNKININQKENKNCKTIWHASHISVLYCINLLSGTPTFVTAQAEFTLEHNCL